MLGGIYSYVMRTEKNIISSSPNAITLLSLQSYEFINSLCIKLDTPTLMGIVIFAAI